MHTKFWSENLNRRDHLEALGVGWEMNIRMDLWDAGWEGVDWIHIDQDRDNWWALVNTVLLFWIP